MGTWTNGSGNRTPIYTGSGGGQGIYIGSGNRAIFTGPTGGRGTGTVGGGG